jgi:hypothetical protein
MLTQSDCKLITEKLLGENRTFQDPQDFFACFEKLVELGEWKKFNQYTRDFYQWSPDGEAEFMQWLLSRAESGHMRLCVLCAEWLKEGKI